MSTTPPPGWYPDPQRAGAPAGGERWWTGEKWSEHARDLTVAAPAEAAETQAYVPMPYEPTLDASGALPARPRAVGTKSSRAKQANYPSWIGLVIGAASLLYNPFALVSIPTGLISLLGLAIAIYLKTKTGTASGLFFALGGIALTIIGVALNWEEIMFFLQLRSVHLPSLGL